MSPNDSITALIVNYQTPHLTRMAVWSLRSLYPELSIVLIDNNSSPDIYTSLQQTADEAGGVNLILNDRNVHHGPAMHQGIGLCNTDWVLLFDSDCIAYRTGFIEKMFNIAQDGAYMTGHLQHIDEHGYNANDRTKNPVPYIHPRCALLNVSLYHTLPPFEKHGAPCMTNQRAALKKQYRLEHFPADLYIYHFARGTIDATGSYHLGLSGQINKMKRLIRNIIRR